MFRHFVAHLCIKQDVVDEIYDVKFLREIIQLQAASPDIRGNGGHIFAMRQDPVFPSSDRVLRTS